MNNARRASLNNIRDRLTEIRDELEEIKDDEQAALDNMPDALQTSERGEHMEGNVNCLDDAQDYIDQCVTALDEALI